MKLHSKPPPGGHHGNVLAQASGGVPVHRDELPPAAWLRLRRHAIAVPFRQAGLIAAWVLMGTAASLVLVALRRPTYLSTARVQVSVQEPALPGFLSAIGAERPASGPDAVATLVDAEIALIRSRGNAQATVDKAAIADGQLVRGASWGLRAEPGGTMTKAATRARRSRTVDLFLQDLSANPVRLASSGPAAQLIELSFACADPALAPLALQAVVDNYLELGAQSDRRLGEAEARRVEDGLAQADDDLRQAEDGIVGLLVRDGGGAGPGAQAHAPGTVAVGARDGLRLDPDFGAAGSVSAPAAVAPEERVLALELRLDEAHPAVAGVTGRERGVHPRRMALRKPLARPARHDSQLGAELERLERGRALAQERFVELQDRLDQIDLFLRSNANGAGARRVLVDAPGPATRADGGQRALWWLGPVVGLLLGLALAARRELGGARMRSRHDVEWALGLPVLGAIPTLSANELLACFEPPTGPPPAASADLA